MPEWYKSRRRKTPVTRTQHPEEDFRDEWNRALMQIHTDLALYKRIRGGRLGMMKRGFKNPKAFLGRTRSGSRLANSPMHSALGMPGLIAGSIGGLSPIDRRSMHREDSIPITINEEHGAKSTTPRPATPEEQSQKASDMV